MVGAVIAMEWVPEESRFICEVLGLLFWTTGVVLVTPIAYLMRDNTWRELQIALTLCSSYSLIQYGTQLNRHHLIFARLFSCNILINACVFS